MSAVIAARRQAGAANSVFYIVLSALVVAGAIIAFLALRQSQQSEAPDTADAGEVSAEWPPAPPQAEPPPIKSVDMQETEIQAATPAPQAQTAARAQGLFDRPGSRVRPLRDGLTGGSEDSNTQTPGPTTAPANAVDAFDFGVLDGRVRIGVFGKGGIPDYRVSVQGQRYTIEMPGQFRYVEEFARRLNINQFGVLSAQLMRDTRGMRMLVEVSPQLGHEPFLIEDPQGLMIAFEPRDSAR